jgi:hypothetical protein
MADQKLSSRTETTTSTGGFLHIVKSLTSFKIAIVNLFKTTEPVTFGGQANSASLTSSFSASKTFSADDGNNQKMLVTASTNVGISDELPGTMIIELEIDSGASPTITPNANLGTVMDNSASFINADNDINIITIYINPDGAKRYTVNTITA